MNQQTQILLQYNRLRKENEACRIEETLLPSEKDNALLSIQEITTGANANVAFTWQHNGSTLLIPVVGNIVINEFASLSPGSALVMAATTGFQYTIQNEQVNDPCLFLQINMALTDKECQFDLNPQSIEPKNKWITLATFGNTTNVGMVKMDGRQEHVLPMEPGEQVTAFIINGAFEMNGCLLHRGDALVLKGTLVAEWEALSEEAIILLIQQKGNG